MEAETYVAKWTVIVRDPEENGAKLPPWKEALPPGAAFFIARDAFGDYWYLPTPELKAPMNEKRKLAPSEEKHSEFHIGVLLPGSMYVKLGGRKGKLFFSINLIDGKHRVLNLSQSHGGVHLLGD